MPRKIQEEKLANQAKKARIIDHFLMQMEIGTI